MVLCASSNMETFLQKILKLVNTHCWGISSAGRAPDLHSGGQRFDPAILHQYFYEKTCFIISNTICHRMCD